MKKLLLTMFIVFGLVSSVYAAAKVQLNEQVVDSGFYVIPQWEEYCSPKYVDAVYIQPTFWKRVSYGSNNIKYNNYWLVRRNNFQNQVNSCNYVQDKYKKACYQTIRDAEANKNKLFEEEYKMDREDKYAQMQYYQQQRIIDNDYMIKKQRIDAMTAPKNYNINVNTNTTTTTRNLSK